MTEINELASAKVVFGDRMEWAVSTISAVCRDLEHAPVTYSWMSVDEFKSLLTLDVERAQRVLILELLYSAHFAAATSIVRAYRWAQGCMQAHSSSLLLPFSANLRGLLEASADSYDALAGVPESMAHAYREMTKSLLGKSLTQFMLFSEIEAQLEHYSLARRLSKLEKSKLPFLHQAKEGKNLLQAVERFGYDYPSLYQELCEYTHPAQSSVCYMLTSKPPCSKLMISSDGLIINELVDRHRDAISEILRFLMPALLILKLISALPEKSLHVRSVQKMDLSFLPLWRRMEQHMCAP